MKRLYEKNELTFALVWIGAYVVLLSLGDSLSSMVGVEKSITAPISLLMTGILLVFLKKNQLLKVCGLTKGKIDLRRYLFFVPLAVIASTNFWGGVTLNYSVPETVLYVLSMVGVGVLEEVIFRGLLFNAMRKDNVKRAVIISSITFGIGHIVNLLNGAEVFATLLQIIYATAAGFLFTVIFLKSGSLIPCIVTHCAINSFSAIAGPRSKALDLVTAAVLTVAASAYALWILRKEKTS